MLFAYIDSQGKEVGIPSVDALQLRIELGAIGEETMFFDARSGKWARAGEHEIFRTLVREVREENPFPAAAPERSASPTEETPPDKQTRPAAPDTEPSAGGSEEEELDVLDPGTLLDLDDAPDDGMEDFDGFDLSAFEPNDPTAAGGEDLFLDGSELQLEGAGDEETGSPSDGGWDADETSGLSDTVGADDAPPGDESSSGRSAASSPPGWFEAGPEEDGLQLEEAWKAGASSAADPGPVEPDEAGPFELDAAEPDAAEPDAAAPDTPGADRGGADRGDADGAHPTVGPPVPEQSAEEAPSSSAEPEAGEPGERPPRPAASAARPSSAGRPTPPRRRGSGAGRRIAVAAVLVIAGAGAWFGWSTLRGERGMDEMEAAVVVPDLPPELEEVHAQAVPGAVEALVETLGQEAASLPEAPDDDWLGGEYLATASTFPEVEAYWTSLGDYLRAVRDREGQIFVDAYTRELERLPVPGPTSRERLVERADAAFRAARAERAGAYDRLDTLIAASLDLHEFLRANEERITYEPTAGGFSRDPVTEAIPATRELGDEMWTRVSRITTAMDALGTVDRLTTQGLVDIVLMRVARTPVR